MKKKKNLFIILFIGVIVIAASSYATYSWFKWRSSSSDAITVNLSGGSTVTFTSGPDIVGSLSPVANYDDGIMKEVRVTSNTSGNTFNLYLSVNEIADELRDESFKWAIYNGNTYIDGGNFSNVNAGDEITILSNRIIPNGTEDVYYVYFWIDSNVENSSDMINKNVDMTLSVYKNGYVSAMMAKKSNSSSTGAFWGSNINANQVKSITFTTMDQKPAGAVTTDISLNAGSEEVVMWLVQNGTTTGNNPITLYDVYVASIDEHGYVYANPNANHLFAYLSNCENISLTNFNTSYVNSMNGMFNHSSKLTSIDLSGLNTSNVTTMSYLFNYCSSLTSIDLSSWDMSSVRNDRVMFQYASAAANIILPDNYTRIDDFMFNHNAAHNSSSFRIPASVTYVGNTHIFYDFGNSSFTSFIVDDGNTCVKSVDGILYSYDGTRLISIPHAKTFTNSTFYIPEGVTELNEMAFSKNYQIQTVVIPNSYIIERDNTAFASSRGYINGGNSLSGAVYRYTSDVKRDNPNYISYNGCIYSEDGTELIAVPLHYTGALNIKDGTTTIGLNAFTTYDYSFYNELTSINIPASVTSIESNQLTAINNIASNKNIPLNVDSGNTAYQTSNNSIVAR